MLDLSTGIFPSIVMDCQPHNLKGVVSRDHTKYTYLKQRIVHILQQLAEVLALLHNCRPKVHHCDVKPDNILLSEWLDVMLTDFGLSEEHKVSVISVTGGTAMGTHRCIVRGNAFHKRSLLVCMRLTAA